MKYNKLTFIELSDPVIRIDGRKRKMGIFLCDCGDQRIYNYSEVKIGKIKQCPICGVKNAALKKITHGLTKHPLYRKWQDIKNRCYNKKVSQYKYYGERGIAVCDEWKNNFKLFYDWSLKNGWKKHLQIERINNDGNYSPENCTFITAREQIFNKRNTFFINYNNTKISLSKILWLNNKSNKYGSIWSGLKKGKPFNYYIAKYNINMELLKDQEKIKSLDLLNNPPF